MIDLRKYFKSNQHKHRAVLILIDSQSFPNTVTTISVFYEAFVFVEMCRTSFPDYETWESHSFSSREMQWKAFPHVLDRGRDFAFRRCGTIT